MNIVTTYVNAWQFALAHSSNPNAVGEMVALALVPVLGFGLLVTIGRSLAVSPSRAVARDPNYDRPHREHWLAFVALAAVVAIAAVGVATGAVRT